MKAMCAGVGLAVMAACMAPGNRPLRSVLVIAPPADVPGSPASAAAAAASAITLAKAEPMPVPAEPPKPSAPAELRAEAAAPVADQPAPASSSAYSSAAAAVPVVAKNVPEPAAEPPEVLYFKSDGYKIAPADLPRLEAHARRLKASPALRLGIHAYADGWGDSDYNLALSKKRAQTVARQLVAMGASADQLDLVYHGERKATREGRKTRPAATDRRVELVYR